VRLTAALLLLLALPLAAEPYYPPAGQWATAAPASLNVDEQKNLRDLTPKVLQQRRSAGQQLPVRYRRPCKA